MDRKPTRAVFLDRDGAIIEEVRHLHKISQLKLIEGAPEAIRLLNESGFKVIVVTNQAVVARGYLTEAYLHQIHQEMLDRLKLQNARIDAIYYCPHHPEEGFAPYVKHCNCRKPKPGMLEQAAKEWGIDLPESFIVGDKVSDLAAGHAVGSAKILVLTGYGKSARHEFRRYAFQPDYIAGNILESSNWIIEQMHR